jgi:hypothetical protein
MNAVLANLGVLASAATLSGRSGWRGWFRLLGLRPRALSGRDRGIVGETAKGVTLPRRYLDTDPARAFPWVAEKRPEEGRRGPVNALFGWDKPPPPNTPGDMSGVSPSVPELGARD